MTDFVKPLTAMNCLRALIATGLAEDLELWLLLTLKWSSPQSEHFEISHLSLNLVEAMIELNDTRRLLLWFVIVLQTFGSLTNCAARPERHVRQWVSLFFSCTEGFWCFEALSGERFPDSNFSPLLTRCSNKILTWPQSWSVRWSDSWTESR